MGEIAISVLKWLLKIGFWSTAIFIWGSLTALIVQSMVMPNSAVMLADIITLVQAWAPFNVGSLIAWLVTTVSVYVGYKLATQALHLINSFVN